LRTILKYAVRGLLPIIAAFALAVVVNLSVWSSYRAPLTLLAHRGFAQTYHR